MSNLFGKDGYVQLVIDRIANSWLNPDLQDADETQRHITNIRGLLARTGLSLTIVPAALSTALPVSTALACGIGLASLYSISAGVMGLAKSARIGDWARLGVSTTAVGALCAVTGGVASPFIPLTLIPLLETVSLRNKHRLPVLPLVVPSAVIATAALFGSNSPEATSPGMMVAGLALLMAFGWSHRTAIGTARPAAAESTEEETNSIDLPAVFAGLPGVITRHDINGRVLAISGQDAKSDDNWIRQAGGRGFVEQIHVSDRIGFIQMLDEIRQGAIKRTIELRMERRASDHLAEQFAHVSVHMMRQTDKNGAFSGIICQTQDIAELQDLRVAAEHHEEAARESEAAKTRFLAAVSHELRTPLNAILGFSDILAHEYFGTFNDERQREYVNLIRESGGHLLSVVNTMLDVSKITAGRYELQLEDFYIAASIERCEAMMSLQATERKLTLTTRITPGCDQVCADRRALQQVLINLVGNALKFTDEGGVVTIDASTQGRHLVLEVGDTGCGMSPEELAIIGRPFVQADNSLARTHEGSGLGLSLVRGLVALHDGELEIDSTKGEGTRVRVKLPLDGSGARQVSEKMNSDAASNLTQYPPALTQDKPVNVATAKEHSRGTAQKKTA